MGKDKILKFSKLKKRKIFFKEYISAKFNIIKEN